MTISIGNRGYVELVSTADGAKRRVKIVSFTGLSGVDTGAGNGGVINAQFDPALQPIAVVDVTDGSLRTAEFSDTGNTRGELTQTDTGPAGHTCWGIFTDTGI